MQWVFARFFSNDSPIPPHPRFHLMPECGAWSPCEQTHMPFSRTSWLSMFLFYFRSYGRTNIDRIYRKPDAMCVPCVVGFNRNIVPRSLSSRLWVRRWWTVPAWSRGPAYLGGAHLSPSVLCLLCLVLHGALLIYAKPPLVPLSPSWNLTNAVC